MKPAEPFFVGWSGRLPARQRGFMAFVSTGIVGLFAMLALTLSATIADVGGGGIDWANTIKREGVLTAKPYPLLHLADGHTLLLAGLGKSGVDADPALDGHNVTASGFLLGRGSLDMLLSSRPDVTAASVETASLPNKVPLGRWRLSGEICDGKCYGGAMRPGEGLAHKACASFCVLGGVPPVLVTTAPVAGSQFLLLAGPGETTMPEALKPLIGVRLTLDGLAERVGDLVVFHADPASVRVE